ncbi:hypothetical protein EJB05_35773 [Eragrostis curvula]|uniref:HhH-GPD domain-containing protein n=1 Tax=Eragrostis curvula TaxID=38414 RepID=A0A5J9U7R1_9POAL|nr:hypothetical protein EJB05_35773 [Eragrostis curvula]
MSAGRGNPIIPGNWSQLGSVRVPTLGCQNHAGTVAAGDGNPITSPTLFSTCSTSTLSAMHDLSASQAAPSSSISFAAEQHAGSSMRPSWNFPPGCTQVPISIVVFHRRLTGMASRLSHSSMPAPPLNDFSEGGASVQLAESNFLSLGRASNNAVGHMAMNPSQLAIPDTYSCEHAPTHLRPNLLDDEAPKTRNEIEASQLQQSATNNYCVSHTILESAVTANTLETRVQHSQGSTALLAEVSAGDNIHMYRPMQKRPKTQISQSEHTPLSTPAVLKERTLTQIEMQITGAEKTETFRNEETPAQKMKTRRKKHRPKVIREDRKSKVQKPVDSTPDGKSPKQKVKRSYVRKKRNASSLEKCSGPVSNESISVGTGIAARRTASVRRSLHFGLEEQGVQEDHASMASSHYSNIENLVHAQSSFCSVAESEVQVGQGLQVDMENSPGILAFDMSLKLNKLLDEYIHLPEVTPKTTQGVSIATSGSFGNELKKDNIGGTCEAGATSRSLPEMEPTINQSKVSKVENHTCHKNGELSLTGARESIIWRAAAEMLTFCQVGGIKKKRSARVRRNSFMSIMDLENDTLQASTRLPQPCMDALYESSYIKFMTKKRSQKARPQCPSSTEPNLELENRLSAGSIECNGPKISEETFHKSSPWTPDNQRINLDVHCKAPEGNSTSTSAVPCNDHLQGVASKMKHLDLNTEQAHRTEMNLSLTAPALISFGGTYGLSNSLVPYGAGVVVPYEAPWQVVKRQRPRAKVDLDFETTRVWNFLMGNTAEPVDGTDVEKERWWQQEREVFEGRANSFIARMRLVQGDRRFSPWKGSVVDSVVGVFLTQNVADHLSSSAFMALAATFPSRSINSNCKDDTTTQDNEQTIGTSSLGEKSMFHLFYNGARPNLEVNCEELSVNYEKIHMVPKDNTSINEFIQGENVSFDCKSADEYVCNNQGTGMEHKAQRISDFSSVELTASTEVLRQTPYQNEISSSQSVTLETRQSRLPSSSGIPRNLAVGGCVASYHLLENNFDHGKVVTGNGTTTCEIERQILKTVSINDDSIGMPGIPSKSTMPFSSTIDSQQLDLRNEPNVSTSPNSSSGSATPYLKSSTDKNTNPLFIPCDSHVAERSGDKTASIVLNSPAVDQDRRTSFEASNLQERESLFVMDEMTTEEKMKNDECTLKSGFSSYNGVPDTEAPASRRKKTRTTSKMNTENFDWDKLRREVCNEGRMKERSFERRDSVDWEAVRCADVQRISHAIRERGMNNILAERIQNFLNRLVRDHGSIDLEWLRDVPPESAKDYLLSIRGLGLKSVECVRLLTLHHLAFPVDTNVGRICVRLGWVPIQPLPESLQLHLLELYELHYHMITFGKVFCTKSKPNCNACPMRSECKHFASAFARLALPAPQDKSLVKSSDQFAFQNSSMHHLISTHLPRLEGSTHARDFLPKNSDPIIEEPASPREDECPETMENDIEDFDEDGEIPTIKLNMEAFAQNLENCVKESNKELQSDDIAKALVAISNEAASIPLPKLKNVHRLRTEHYVYELPDSHPLVQQVRYCHFFFLEVLQTVVPNSANDEQLGLDQREPDDPSEIKEISDTPKPCSDSQVEGGLCNNEMCHNCSAERQNQSRYVRGTILVPCRTAMRGSFPLNGTYFQVNEVFADHKSSHNPIHIDREQLWNLHRRMVFFGTSVPTIFRGLTTEEIQHCFWRGRLKCNAGFVCVRGFDMEFRAPRPLCPRLHMVARPRTRKTQPIEQNQKHVLVITRFVGMMMNGGSGLTETCAAQKHYNELF